MSILLFPSRRADPPAWFRRGIARLIDDLDDVEVDALCDLFIPRAELELVPRSPVENRTP